MNMRMRVWYLDCHETGLCCYLVIHIENQLHPLQLFYFHLWPIYRLSLVFLYDPIQHPNYCQAASKSEALTALTMKVTVFWDEMPSSVVKYYQCLGGTCCPLVQGTLNHRQNNVQSAQGCQHMTTRSTPPSISFTGLLTRSKHNCNVMCQSLQNSLPHRAEPFLRSQQLCSYSRISQHFMEPEDSLPCSQEPSTGPYPEPDRSSLYHLILSLQHPF
jgi:hypothetical protein